MEMRGRACIAPVGVNGHNIDNAICSLDGDRQCACPTSTTGEGCLECMFQNENASHVMRCTRMPPNAFTQSELGPAFVPGYSIIRRRCRGGRYQDVSRERCNCQRIHTNTAQGTSTTDRSCAEC